MSDRRSISCVRNQWRWIVAGLLTFTAGLAALMKSITPDDLLAPDFFERELFTLDHDNAA
ncbi:MAG: hypothetical protein DME22_17270 [Verrucomicrobia bacterium]|nr:MAG: hypothetical protein DME22_17270 [Verrucomicrobiota bacterium]PYJ97893.1 MAG: hypothetical protein DME23_13435 [Verrucomicrobiota bacterium]